MRITHVRAAAAATIVALGIGSVAVARLTSSQAASSPACTRLASSAGSDSAAGTPSAPWRTASKLLASLKPGDVGCLAAGQTFGSPAVENMVTASDVTLES